MVMDKATVKVFFSLDVSSGSGACRAPLRPCGSRQPPLPLNSSWGATLTLSCLPTTQVGETYQAKLTSFHTAQQDNKWASTSPQPRLRGNSFSHRRLLFLNPRCLSHPHESFTLQPVHSIHCHRSQGCRPVACLPSLQGVGGPARTPVPMVWHRAADARQNALWTHAA